MLPTILILTQYNPSQSIETKLRQALSEVPGVTFQVDQEELLVRYRTKNTKVQAESKSKQIVKKEVVKEIPEPTGFKLETYDFPHRPAEPPRAMQAVSVGPAGHDMGSWRWIAEDVQIDGKDSARYYYLAWGSKLSPKVLATVRRCLVSGTHPIGQR